MKTKNLLTRGVKSLTAAFFILTFILAMTLCTSAAPAELVIIDEDTEWKYLDDGTDACMGLSGASAWTTADFNDSAWKSAKGSFGSVNGKLSKVSNITPDNLINLYFNGTSDCITTAFFRTTVNVSDVSSYKNLAFKINADDAIAIFVNGTPILDTRAQKNNTSNLYYTSGNTTTEAFILELSQYPDLFKNGENVIAAQVHNNSRTSSDILFSIEKMILLGNVEPVVAESVVLNVGSSETERNLAWFSNVKTAGQVKLAKASEVQNGVFPAECKTFSVNSKAASNAVGKYAKSATITGLEENTKYAYVIEMDGKTSKIFYFNTKPSGDYTFAYFGDPQLFSTVHSSSWRDSVNKAKMLFSPAFMITAGDQVNAPENEKFYSYFIVDDLASISLAATVGPGHDSPCATFSDHFNLPNLSEKYGANETSANYWYTYENTLFMHLNMSDTEAYSNGEHKNFLKEAIAANQDATWKIVVMHNSLFSVSDHANAETTVAYRKTLAPVFTELDIDVVLSAHEHIYVRSKMMINAEVCDDIIEDNKVVDPKGILYLCASSSSNSKYYSKEVDADYAAFVSEEKRKSAIKIDVTDESMTFTSYYLDKLEVFDTFVIEKTTHTCELQKVDEIPVTCTERGQRAYYVCECGRAYEDAEGKVGIVSVSEWATIYPDGHSYAGECDPDCDKCGESRQAPPHSDADGNSLCDVCGATLEGGDKGGADDTTTPTEDSGNTVIIICAVGAGAIAVGVVVFVILRKKGKKA